MRMPKRFIVPIGLCVAVSVAVRSATPKLDLRTKSGTPLEMPKKEQIERLAAQYDLSLLRKFGIQF
jgi:hypothetical protein